MYYLTGGCKRHKYEISEILNYPHVLHEHHISLLDTRCGLSSSRCLTLRIFCRYSSSRPRQSPCLTAIWISNQVKWTDFSTLPGQIYLIKVIFNVQYIVCKESGWNTFVLCHYRFKIISGGARNMIKVGAKFTEVFLAWKSPLELRTYTRNVRLCDKVSLKNSSQHQPILFTLFYISKFTSLRSFIEYMLYFYCSTVKAIFDSLVRFLCGCEFWQVYYVNSSS